MEPNSRQRVHLWIDRSRYTAAALLVRLRKYIPARLEYLADVLRRWVFRHEGESIWRPCLRMALLAIVCLLPVVILFSPLGCGVQHETKLHVANAPIVRVRLMQGVGSVQLIATESARFRLATETVWHPLNLRSAQATGVTLVDGQWHIGNLVAGGGQLVIEPGHEGTLSITSGNNPANGSYRGRYRLLPMPDGKFDLINDVDVDSYVAGVLARELKQDWHSETYRAMAIVARTYVLYEASTSQLSHREWDVYADTRSQVYGGIAAESNKSRDAASYTSSVVVAFEQNGKAQIFKPYYSSCCGGVTQSALDAFGESWIAPLSDQTNHTDCNASPNFNWGPVVIRKDELTRRFRIWANRTQRAEKAMAPLASIAVQQFNRFGRPTRFLVTDAKGAQYSLSGEELRWAVNADAENDPHKADGATTLKSSFVKVITTPEEIRFVEGHGWGHGVGLCQWCAEHHAEEHMQHEDIVLAAYPGAKLVRAY